MKDYSYCKIKWLLDFKYFSPVKVLISYGFLSTIIYFILGILSSFIKWTEKKENESIKYIDSICKTNKIVFKNKTIYYYDSFSIYFKNLKR